MSNFHLLSNGSCYPSKYVIMSVILVVFYIYYNKENIELDVVDLGVGKYIYSIKSLELNPNYTIGKTQLISEKELNGQFIKSSVFSFDDIFGAMENTLRSSNSTCVAMHHYKLNEPAKQMVGMLINNKTDFIMFVNPTIEAKSINDQVHVRFRNSTTKRFQYIWVNFYFDLMYGRDRDDGLYVYNNERLLVKRASWFGVSAIFERFYKGHVPKSRFVKVNMRLHNEYSICIQNIMDEF